MSVLEDGKVEVYDSSTFIQRFKRALDAASTEQEREQVFREYQQELLGTWDALCRCAEKLVSGPDA